MSNSRRICVCGRERGKQPVVITITTCRKNHQPNGDGSLCISSNPQATSSPIQIGGQPNVTNHTQKSETGTQEDSSNRVENQSKDISDVNSSLPPNDSSYETANASSTQPAETATESTLTPDHLNNTDPTLYKTAETSSHDTKKVNTTTTMFATITEFNMSNTGINTTPFLDNLFWKKSTTNIHSILENRPKIHQNECQLEILVFEKHPINCRHQLSEKDQNVFYDGNFVFESIGRISFPIPATEDNVVYRKSTQSLGEYLKADDHLKVNPNISAKRKMELFENIENYVKNKQNQENVCKKLPEVDPVLEKYIAIHRDVVSKSSSMTNTDEIYFKKDTTERGVQFRSSIYKMLKQTRWYNNFLLCFGIKSDDNLYQRQDFPKHEVQLKNSSTYIISKYLRV
ncbi:uncharacterized protein LOC126735572 [Anthonomus grandis grandis]|uniref:uncharacterized protein LOC126735572 n=1 Tax=Anthonomus grandis grandis TaxID=2921223 RepID=UPI002166AA1E|nr:uncharacterized protein LOC126735572 [Anthonomus grandis grandis]